MLAKLEHEQLMSSKDLTLLTWVIRREGVWAMHTLGTSCEHEYMYEGLSLQDQWTRWHLTQLERVRMV